VSGDNALDARRLAFALAKLSHMPGAGPIIEGHAVEAERKE
jgi:hypothetical protein